HVQLPGVLVDEREAHARGPAPISRVEEPSVGPLPRIHRLMEMAAPVGAVSEALKVAGSKRLGPVCGREELERLPPGTACERVPAGIDPSGRTSSRRRGRAWQSHRSRLQIDGRRPVDVELGVLEQDRLLQAYESGARLEPKLFDERLSQARERCQCVGLASAAIEREHELTPKTLAQRMLDHELSQLSCNFRVCPQ